MRAVWKYQLGPGVTLVEMPDGAEILTAQMQEDILVLWALVEPRAPKSERVIEVCETGEELLEEMHGARVVRGYIATVQSSGGLVYHIFEWLDPIAALRRRK